MSVVAIYLRISQDRENTGEGVARQRSECLLRVQDGETVRFYEDNDKSASSNVRREDYERLKLDVKKGEIQRVLAWSLDRLTRKPRDIEDWIDLSKETGVQISTVRESIDVTNEAGRANLRIIASMAAMEVERKSARQKAANRQRIETGQPVKGGRRPYGFEQDGVHLRFEEAEWIAHATQQVIQGKSLVSIARELNAKGVKTSTGKAWSTTQLRTMLLRERNCGRLLSLGKIEPNSQIEPAVSEVDFDLCKGILTNPDRVRQRGPVPEKSWLSGFLRCEVCGAPMFAKNITGKNSRGRYYICGSKPSGRAQTGEVHPSVSCRIAEKATLDFLANLFSEGPRKRPQEANRAQSRLREILAAQHANTERRSALTEDLLAIGVDKKILKDEIAKLVSEFHVLEAERQTLMANGAARELLFGLLEAGNQKSMSPGEAVTALVEAVERFREEFEALPSDQKRTIVDGTLTASVSRGWGARRISFGLIEPDDWWLAFDEES
jgi:site-specific DNA recombinase